MVTLSSIFEESDLTQAVVEQRSKFHEARAEYELAMRRLILHRVEHCPHCFKSFFDDMKLLVKEEAFHNDFEPDELDILKIKIFIK